MAVYRCVCDEPVHDDLHNSGKMYGDKYVHDDDFSEGRDVNECKHCGALAIEYSNKIKFYIPVDKVVGNLFSDPDYRTPDLYFGHDVGRPTEE